MIDSNKPVRVFKNLKHDCYSIFQGGRLCASARQVRLVDVEFRVREKGRQKMIAEQRRTIHAFAVGRLLDFVHPGDARELGVLTGRGAFYSPYEYAHFVDTETRVPVMTADVVQFDEAGLTYDRDDEHFDEAA